MTEIKEQLQEILEEIHPDVDFANEKALIDERILVSFDIVTLISEICDRFDVTITADKIIPENFNSLDAMARLVSDLLDED